MSKIFDEIITKGVRSGQIPARTQAARDWYREAASYKNVGKVNENKLFKNSPDRLSQKIKIGNMYMFRYLAKHRDTLPYWDQMPLIFPFAIDSTGFYGINLHYLPLKLRAKLMDALYDYTNNQKYDETTKIKISYQLLKSVAKLRYFRPCVKRYLWSQMQSQFLYIYPSEWDISIFLPTARFKKRTANYVHAKSEKSLR